MPNAETKPNRTVRRRAKTRQSILDAARELFQEKSIDDITIGELADMADIARASIYNHFGTIEDIVSALAEDALLRTVEKTRDIVRGSGRDELLPWVGACVAIRMMGGDPSIRWLLARPNILAAKHREILVPLMREQEAQLVSEGRLDPAGGHEAWLSIHPWLAVGVLAGAEESGDLLEQERRYATFSTRLLGIEDKAESALAEARRLVDAAGL